MKIIRFVEVPDTRNTEVGENEVRLTMRHTKEIIDVEDLPTTQQDDDTVVCGGYILDEGS